MSEKIKKYQTKIIKASQELRDIRTLGMVVFVGVLLLMTWSGAKVVETNYGLQKQINELQQQTETMRLQNDTLKLGNEYYNTSTYLELSARQNFGLAKPGETEISIPKEVALSKLAKVETHTGDAGPAVEDDSFVAKNFRSWINFFMHRHQVVDTSDWQKSNLLIE